MKSDLFMTRSHRGWLMKPALLVCVTLGIGYGAGNPLGLRVARAASGEEPTGGSWLPIVASGTVANPLVDPPGSASPQLDAELAELINLQKKRTVATNAIVKYWDKGAVVRWNEIARNLVIKYRTAPPPASRVYALVSTAQFDAAVAAWKYKYKHNRKAPKQMNGKIVPLVTTTPDPVYPSEHAVIAAASATVLEYLYPNEVAFLESKVQEHATSRLWAGVSYRSDITAADQLGREIAQQVIDYAKTDGSDAVWTGTVPTGPGLWVGTNPVLPLWGQVRPWLMTDSSQFRPPPPPAFDSPEFKAALAEVRRISDTRTAEQLRIAQFWADSAGTSTPPGHWNQIACDLIVQRYRSELRAARALALMNLAVMDAGICCWDTKFTYWLIRPYQADPAITTPVGRPNFPSYTSGHSSFSGAASTVLAYLFPQRKDALRAMANEAAISRLYGGIHYHFDNDRGQENGESIGDLGLKSGRGIGALAVQRGQSDGSPAG